MAVFVTRLDLAPEVVLVCFGEVRRVLGLEQEQAVDEERWVIFEVDVLSCSRLDDVHFLEIDAAKPIAFFQSISNGNLIWT